MERMRHIHGTILDQGGAATLVEGVDGYLGCHEKKNGVKEYFGYFEMPAERIAGKVLPGGCYKLVLDDGRSGMIYADVHPGNDPAKLVAEFHVSGSLRAQL